VTCKCGAWVELVRHTSVTFSVARWSPTVPPWVFGLEGPNTTVLPPAAEPEEKIPQEDEKISPRNRKKFPWKR
jgi:hypothetical protein